jgi:hypothetical protein
LDTSAKTKKDTLWTKLPVSVELMKFLTRQVLIEKFSAEKAKKAEMTEFFISKLDGCELFTHKDYPDIIFYIKEKSDGKKEILIERSEKNKTFYIKYSTIWSVFEKKYGLNYSEIQSLTQHLLEDLLNSQGYKTTIVMPCDSASLEDLLNSQGYKTKDDIQSFSRYAGRPPEFTRV